MSASAIIIAIKDVMASLEASPGVLLFAHVQAWNPDAPDAQLQTLQSTEGRFALVLHEETAYTTQQLGRTQTSILDANFGILISNAEWAGQTPPLDAPGALECAESVANALAGHALPGATETLTVSKIERFRPDEESGRAAGRICYRVGLMARIRAQSVRTLQR